MRRSEKEKALKLGMELIENARFDKKAFLEAQGSLTPPEVAEILGEQERNVTKELPPSFYNSGGRPRWIRADVLKHREKKKKAKEKLESRNRGMLQRS